MYNAFRILLLFFTGIIFCTELHAQGNKLFLKDCNNLDSLSNIFFEAGDNDFLIVDAYRDGLIKDNTYRFTYREGNLQLNGKQLNAPYNNFYLSKLREVQAKMDEKPGDMQFTMGPGAPLGQPAYVYTPPMNRFEAHERMVQAYLKKTSETDTKDSLLVAALIKDKIIYSGQSAHIRYNKFGVWLNSTQLSNVKSRKYIPVLERLTRVAAPDVKTAYVSTDLTSFETTRYGALRH